eukprot:CAMPEP_0184296600 /NCGR_PEP_ID=MMETSP1049-20130417/7566_1 /TAXON_ID=77928 /ORGANISM="Proteomonas sulcata, Strain CCMP704" /LENGTH=81 /DNA_ID=CAMNT_0026605923 /DNA_START=535 /DNA_END=780 /DNA_ORIENTATION=-
MKISTPKPTYSTPRIQYTSKTVMYFWISWQMGKQVQQKGSSRIPTITEIAQQKIAVGNIDVKNIKLRNMTTTTFPTPPHLA